MFRRSFFAQLAVTITALIFLIELILLVGSYYSKEKEYQNLNAEISRNLKANHQLVIENPLSQTQINKKMKIFVRNVSLMTLLIIFIVVLGTCAVFHWIAGRHLNLLVEYNKKTDATHIEYVPEDKIPQTEIGEVIRSRNEMLKNLESAKEQLAESARLSAIGEMTGGIAHEINNPIAAVQSRADQLSEILEEEPLDLKLVKNFVSHIQKTTQRVAKIVHGMRIVARDGTTDELEQTPVWRLFEDTVELCQQKIEKIGAQLIIDDIPKDLEINCRPAQVVQVTLNLLSNAVDAIEGSENLWIRLSVEEKENSVLLLITDSGNGIPKEIADQLFAPFYTTKATGKGTGLGLSLSKKFIENHSGTLTINHESPNTQFVIELPKNPKLQKKAKAA